MKLYKFCSIMNKIDFIKILIDQKFITGRLKKL